MADASGHGAGGKRRKRRKNYGAFSPDNPRNQYKTYVESNSIVPDFKQRHIPMPKPPRRPNSPGPRGAYQIQYGAPDLSNVYQLAASAGTNAGYNAFLTDLIDYERDLTQDRLRADLKRQEILLRGRLDNQERRRKRAEEAAEASSDPNHGGFWDKLSQIGAEGLQRTVDVLSRFNYASAEAAERFFDIDEEDKSYEEKSFLEKITSGAIGKSPLEVIDDFEFSDVGNMLEGAWEGFTGKEKTTFGKVIAKNAKQDKSETFHDSKLYQGVLGFTGDVLLDPTTYVGIGLVTKPLKAGSRAARAASKSGKGSGGTKELDNLASDIEKLGVKEEGSDIPLQFEEIRAMLGGRPKTSPNRGRLLTKKSTQAANVREFTENVSRIKAAIKRDPDIDNSAVAKLDSEIDRLTKQRGKHLDEWTKTAYAAKVAEFDSNPKLWNFDVPNRTSLLDNFNKSTSLAKTAHAFQSDFFRRTRSQNNKSFEDVLGDGYKQDARISDEFRQSAVGTTERLAKQDGQFRRLTKKNIQINNQLKSMRENLKKVPEGTEKQKLLDRIKARETERNNNYMKQNYIKANIFHSLLRMEMGVGNKEVSQALNEEFSELISRKADIERSLKNMSEVKDEVPAPVGPVVKTSGEVDGALDSMVFNQKDALVAELKQIDTQLRELSERDEFMARGNIEKPEGMPKDFKVTDDWLKKDIDDPEIARFQNEIEREVNSRTEELLDTKVQTFLRRAKEDKLNAVVPDRIRSMFGASGKSSSPFGETLDDSLKTPKITSNGKPILKTDKAAIANAGLITKADVEEAVRRSELELPGSALPKLTTGSKLQIGESDLAARIDGFVKSHNVKVHPAHIAFDRVFKEQHGIAVRSAIRAKTTALKDVKQTPKVLTEADVKVPRQKLREEAHKDALKSVNTELSAGTLKVLSSREVEFELWDDANFNRIYEANKQAARDEYAEQVLALKEQDLPTQVLTAQIDELRKVKDTKLKLQKEAFEEAVRARKAMDERVDEQLLLNMLEENVATGRNYMRISAAGVRLADIPSPRILTKATEKIGGLPILQASHKIWSNAFKPASQIEPELNLARLRAQARTPDIIKHHVNDIRHRFSKYKPDERRAALNSLVTKAPVGNKELVDETQKYFDEMVPYLTGKVGVGEGDNFKALTLSDINRWLGEKYQFVGKSNKYIDGMTLDNPQKIIEAMRRLPKDTDPMEVMWNLRIAMEQALANKTMKHTITEMYGVKRVLGKMVQDEDKKKIVEALHDNHGWTTVRDLGEEYYFSPEAATEIHKLLDMMKPETTQDIMRLYDKVLRGWKSAVTVYNPGYYTRNAIGETIMGAFDGLYNPKWYGKAGKILKYAMPDSMEDTLKQLEPWKRHQTLQQKGARPIMKMKHGKELSVEDVWVLYHDTGLKSGFISSEFEHYFPSAGTFKASGVGQVGSKINDGVREAGEKFEDYFRLAHFMYRMEQSNARSVTKAAEEAAQAVRKYHFDYTDFTPFEKTKMMRIFPFYKWTRKALPLMGSMLFAQPGKAMIYPKAMQNISYATGGTDPLADDNGFYPNYEKVTPKWMRGLLGYPIGRDEAEAMTYMNIATPQFDVYKMAQNPIGTSIGMFSPVLKVPFEQMIGRQVDPDFDMDVKTPEERLQHIARTTPLTSLLNNINRGSEPGEDSAISEPTGQPDEKLTSFLTGLGFYENNKDRQAGEQYRRNMEE